jgi:hypothetical protein
MRFLKHLCREMLFTFARTISNARNVFLMYFSLIMIASGMGHIWFRTTVNVDNVQNSWSTFFRSFITAFIFISTGDNYEGCVYEAFNVRGINGKHIKLRRMLIVILVAFFLIAEVLGTVLIMALVLSFFQDGFADALRSALLRMKLKDRLGMIGAFILIDLNNSGTVDRTEFGRFVKRINEYATDKDVDFIFDTLNEADDDDDSEPVLDVQEFVKGVEQSSEVQLENVNFEISTVQQLRDRHSWEHLSPLEKAEYAREYVRWSLYPFVSSKSFDVIVLVCIMLQLFVLSLYGSGVSSSSLDTVNGVLVLLNTLDMMFKVLVYGRAVSRDFVD